MSDESTAVESAPVATLADLAVKHGHTRDPDPQVVRFREEPTGTRYSWQHQAADALHGWTEHEQHTQEKVMLSDEDYLAALAAVEAPKNTAGGYDAHAPALHRHIKADEKAAARAAILKARAEELKRQRKGA